MQRQMQRRMRRRIRNRVIWHRGSMKQAGRYLRELSLLLMLSFAVLFCTDLLRSQCAVRTVNTASEEEVLFREMRMSQQTISQLEQLSRSSFLSKSELLALFYAETRGDFSKLPDARSLKKWMKRRQLFLAEAKNGYERLKASYAAIWDDLVCFPVAAEGIRYENSWMFERNYGGIRGHEGTDLMPAQNLSGCYPVCSMTDGVVEQIGWLERGGYRIGVRSPSGGYFYYAHLDSYEQEFQIGDTVHAGQILGRMGDTGYGVEGTRGKFAVHLHLGIYIRTRKEEELSINPYWILRFLEGSEP